MHHATDFPTRPLAPVRDDRPRTTFPPLAQALRQSRRPVVFTGAGVSAESGIATFRDALTGLWSRFDAQALATPEAFRAHPDLVWGWYEWRREQALRPAERRAPGHRQTGRACAGAHRDHAERGRSARARGQSESTASAWQPARAAPPIAARPGAAPSPRALTPRQPAQRQPIRTATPRRHAASGARGTGQGRRIEPPRCAACGSRAARRRRFGKACPPTPGARPARRRAMRSAAEHRHLGPGLSAAELPQRALARAPSSRRSIRPPRQWMRA